MFSIVHFLVDFLLLTIDIFEKFVASLLQISLGMRSFFFFLSFTLLASFSASACLLEETPAFTYEQGEDKVVPVLGKMTEDLYHRALDKVEKIYRPIVAKSGGNLVLERDYNSETENARTFREGNDWTIIIDGFWFKNRRYQTYKMLVWRVRVKPITTQH